ncbi:MAG: TolC family protein [Cyclobacteriaceae bacterium]
MRILVCIVVLLSLGVDSLYGQQSKVLSLDDCITLAMENNIALQKAKNNSLIAQSNQFQALMDFLPSLNASTNYDFFFGTFFDTNAAKQVSATTNSSNPRLSSNLTLFNGFAKQYNMKARWYQSDASLNSIEEQKLSVKSSVLGSYLNVILDRENIKISKERLELLEQQLDREKKRESVGVGNLEMVYNFKSQLANERLNQVNLTNRLDSDKLTLLQALGVNISDNYQIAEYDFQGDQLLLKAEAFDDVLNSSVSFSPGIKRAQAEMQASSYQFKRARAGYMPTISLTGVYGSNYSSNGARNPETGVLEENASFFDQMDFNKFKYINFSLRVPIFGNWRNRNRTQIAKINMVNSELDLKQSELIVTNAVQQVYMDLVSAQSTYVAARENLLALNQSFEFVKTRHENGNTDFFTYLESLNNKNRAEIELVNAKYSIIFRKKILDVYKGLY